MVNFYQKFHIISYIILPINYTSYYIIIIITFTQEIIKILLNNLS